MANEQAQQGGMDIEQIKSDIAEKANELIGQAVEFAKEKPHVAVGAAFAIGWVLGNGLPPRVIMGAARVGWKAMLGGALAGTGIMGILGGQDEGEGASRGPAVRSAQPSSHRREGHGRARNGTSTTGSQNAGGTGGGNAVKD